MLRRILADLAEVRAVIALLLSMAFVAAVFTGRTDKDLTTVFLVIVAFYFGMKSTTDVPPPKK